MAPTDTPLADLKVETISQEEFDSKKPPTRGKPTTTRKPKMPLPPWKDGVISGFMENLYTTAGDLIEPYNEAYGVCLKAIAPQCAQAWEECAKDSPWLRRWIHQMMTASKFSKLAMAHMPLIIVALHEHGPLRQATDRIAEGLNGDDLANYFQQNRG